MGLYIVLDSDSYSPEFYRIIGLLPDLKMTAFPTSIHSILHSRASRTSLESAPILQFYPQGTSLIADCPAIQIIRVAKASIGCYE